MFFHLSAEPRAEGFVLRPQGPPKLVDTRVEDILEECRPEGALARAAAVFLAPTTNFERLGLSGGYLHEVTTTEFERHDAGWLRNMQLTFLVEKHPSLLERYPLLTDSELRVCAKAYWCGDAAPEDATAAEVLAPLATVIRLVRPEPVIVSASWPRIA
jgi:hypothetical protein